MRITFSPLLLFALSGCLCADDPGNLVPKTVAEDLSLPAIEINGTRLHSEAFGDPDGPVILVLHGGPGSDYRGLLPLRALAEDGYRVAFWDQRGTGLSERLAPETIDLEVYMEDLRQVIEYYAPGRPFVFIGQSWGAMYATAFINDHGDYGGRIKGAILTEPGAFTDKQLDGFITRLQASLSITGEQFNDALWAGQFITPTDHERADYQGGLFAMRGAPAEHRDPNNLEPMWRFGAAVSKRLQSLAKDGFDWTTHLSAYPHEVLFLRGDLNTAANLESQQEMAAAYPNAVIETIPNAGHKIIWERTDEYLAHTRAYLREIGFVK
ncbi:MAG TPA: alpha/beta hydrolase [Kofleriaceae bacterium]|nr:alpha/beta hydrolase [Kofleriaceae bacterium]